MERRVKAGEARPGDVWCGTLRFVESWQGEFMYGRRGKDGIGLVRRGEVRLARQGPVRLGMARWGRQGRARHGRAWLGAV